MFNRNRLHTNLFFHEAYKVFVAQGVIIIFIIAGIASYAFFVKPTNSGNSMTSIQYDYYSEKAEGKYEKSTEKYIDDTYNEVNEHYDANYKNADWIEKMILDSEKGAVERMSGYKEYLDTKEGAYYINNDGYTKLTYGNSSINRQNAITMVLVAVFASLSFVSVMSVDYQNGEEVLVHTTLRGGKCYRRNKLAIGLIIAICLYVIFWVPRLVSYFDFFGTEYIDAPPYSLMHLKDVPKWISIKGYIIIIAVIRFLIECVMMSVSYFISTKVRSKSVCIISTLIVTIIPIVIYLTM